MGEPGHIPVMLDGVLRLLSPAAGETYIDATAGLGGHAEAVAGKVGDTGTVVLNDADAGNLERAGRRVRAAFGGRLETLHGNFAEVPYKVGQLGGAGGKARGDMLLADLGFASNQVDIGERGLSFNKEGPLDMRLDQSRGVTAAELVRGLPEAELARIIAEYGEERLAGRVARKLVQARAQEPILTTARLADVVRSAVPRSASGGIDPATRTFQALRIAVNDELGSLEALLAALSREAAGLAKGKEGSWLKGGARVVFISFHSLEDRRVKRWVQEIEKFGAVSLTKGVLEATEDEVRGNPRARSAKVRAVRFPSP